MSQESDRYGRALKRLLNEVQWAISKRNANNEIYRLVPRTTWSFFSYASVALINDMMTHAIKILDEHKDVASFWYIYRCKQGVVERELKKIGLGISEIRELTDKVKLVRDKTHFHIDKSKVFAPNKVWASADIKGEKFNKVIDGLLVLFHALYKKHFGEILLLRTYDAEDVEMIIDAARERGIKI